MFIDELVLRQRDCLIHEQQKRIKELERQIAILEGREKAKSLSSCGDCGHCFFCDVYRHFKERRPHPVITKSYDAVVLTEEAVDEASQAEPKAA